MTQFTHASVRPPAMKQAASTISKLIMTGYRWVGFAILISVLGGLVSYIGLNAVYLFHKGWMGPVIISPTDARVLDLTSRAAQEGWQRQKLEVERANLEAQVRRSRRVIEAEEGYQATIRKSVSAEAQSRLATLGQLQALRAQYRDAKAQIEDPTSAFAALSKERSEQQFSAKLIDQDTLTARSRQLAEIAQSQLNLRERQVELGSRVSTLARELAGLRDLSASPELKPGAQPLNYEALAVVHAFDQSVLAARNAEDEVAAAERGFAALTAAAAHYDKLIKTLETAPLVRAATQKLTLAFVPYENLGNAAPGTVIFGCRLQVVWCARAGTVRTVLEGEVVAKHPLYGWDLRGQFIELEVEDPQAMKLPVLHARRPPLLF